MKKILTYSKNALLVLLGLLLVFLIGTSIWNQVVCSQENLALSQVGTDVNVNGTNIRVSVTGTGEKTVVLLSGMGTPSPITDFKPLADRLSKKYRVVTLEYPGYGLSEDTDKDRTNVAIVEEIRATLDQLNIEPPYILVPHSLSGIYCLEYMNSYPEEVKAMIGIDSSVPNQGKYDDSKAISKGLVALVRFMDMTGLTRLSYLSGDAFLQDMAGSGNYTEQEIKNITALYSRKSISNALLNENQRLPENLKALYDVKLPEDIPVLFILSNDSCAQLSDELTKRGFDRTWEGLHEEVISNAEIQMIERLDGGHYLHWTQSDVIADMVDRFGQANF